MNQSSGPASASASTASWLPSAAKLEHGGNVPYAPVFEPTLGELEDPRLLLQKIEPLARPFGLAKIRIPPEWGSSSPGVPTPELKFRSRLQRLPLHHWRDIEEEPGILREEQRLWGVKAFQKKAEKSTEELLGTTAPLTEAEIEARFWSYMVGSEEINISYGSDVVASAFQEGDGKLGDSAWNLKAFGKAGFSLLRHIPVDFPGITSPMLYVGSSFSTFFYHMEDQFLYSISHNHHGAAKTWYGVPAYAAGKFEDYIKKMVYKDAVDSLRAQGKDEQEIDNLVIKRLMKKNTMWPPILLKEADIPVFKAHQRPGEYVITFPKAYHGGFNHGFNIAEAVNFALPEWLIQGSEAVERYAKLKLPCLLPFEDMFVKEALALEEKHKSDSEMTRDDYLVAAHFSRFMENLHTCLRKQQQKNKYSTLIQLEKGDERECDICGRHCLLSYFTSSNDLDEAICLVCGTKNPPEDNDTLLYIAKTQYNNLIRLNNYFKKHILTTSERGINIYSRKKKSQDMGDKIIYQPHKRQQKLVIKTSKVESAYKNCQYYVSKHHEVEGFPSSVFRIVYSMDHGEKFIPAQDIFKCVWSYHVPSEELNYSLCQLLNYFDAFKTLNFSLERESFLTIEGDLVEDVLLSHEDLEKIWICVHHSGLIGLSTFQSILNIFEEI